VAVRKGNSQIQIWGEGMMMMKLQEPKIMNFT